ncbi:unnamed protein product [Rhizopus stolonifer]
MSSLDIKRGYSTPSPISPQTINTCSSFEYLFPNQPYDPKNPALYCPTPPPQTIIVHKHPSKSKASCCWGCLAALCLCFGAKECCSSE